MMDKPVNLSDPIYHTTYIKENSMLTIETDNKNRRCQLMNVPHLPFLFRLCHLF